MTRVETTAVVSEDRMITVQLPEAVSPGKHAVVVLVDEADQSDTAEAESPVPDRLVRKGKLLVFVGKLEADFDPHTLLHEIYEERERRFLYGPFE